ncbi:MAG: mannan endo-1,4-beta-mannosidase A and B [Clostridiales bacterium]|nr:mannan endo-1,4-beta-mannosidase A and B [Clostridiales bacterium]
MRQLTNPNALPVAVRLYEYICSLQGKKCLTGQMESGWCGTFEGEINYLLARTGTMPAIRGLDFINNDFQGCVQRARDWHARGGIVTICWHTGPDFASSYKQSQENDLDWAAAFTPGTNEHRDLIANMDRAVPYLQQLQRMNIPVLWRPFHEFDGKWFWWGRGGEEGFIRLWRMMYDRYTNLHGLNNLIWVLGFSDAPGDLKPWYPGDDVVDILGGDSYKGGAQGDLYRRCAEIAPAGMPICYHENGEIPSRAQMEAENAPWVWFMTWHTKWITSDEFNTPEKLREVFQDDYFIKLHQVADFITEG